MAVDEELSVSWSVEMEVNLFHAMRGHKPVGVNKNFQMMCIHDKLQQSMGRKVTSQQIWQHLSTMYDMQALHESEILPFPNNQSEFTLPTEEYGELMSGKRKAAPSNVEESTPKESLKTTIRLPTMTSLASVTPSEKDNSPKRKRTRQGTSAPNPDILASKRRR
ncbi:MRG/MORF4L-binding protein-like isoform X1 [Acanthaster planci]|uniref:MRG/MORF4L-binding protein-like isoform X1 n=1 Tax=Acanthaster planci TaxID=133434 RepID=A0A8B7Z0Y0_ACAPL|nr:MRG/MORF4L-binding protein-like isoform X1 [Acanthaster planci]